MKHLHACRHKHEMPVYRLGIIANIIAMLVIVGGFAMGGEVAAFFEEYLEYVGLIFVMPVIILVIIMWNYAKVRANAVEINEKQFPDVYKMYVELALEMGFAENKIPKLYMKNGNGLVNAYASKCNLNRSFAMIYSDIFEVVKLHGDYSTLKFVLAHELGHIGLGHVSIRRNVLTFITGLFIPYRQTLTRAQELSADRVAAKYAPETIARGPMILSAGKMLYPDVNIDAYIEQLKAEKQDIFIRGVNLMSSHPIMIKRIVALDDIHKHGLKKHGDLF